jgi:hypothetical protein
MPLPKPPEEVPVRRDLSLLAPRFRRDVLRLLVRMQERGFDPIVAEAFRDDDRQRYLYGFGREYDDGRGVVTNAATAAKSWHGFGLAVDIISASKGWDAPEGFWTALGEECREIGLCWGNDWDGDGVPVEKDPDERMSDRPHVQPGRPLRRYPSALAKQIVDEHGLEALWRTVKAA